VEDAATKEWSGTPTPAIAAVIARSVSRSPAPATRRCLPATRLRATRPATHSRLSCRAPASKLHQRTTTSCRANTSAGTFTTKDPIGFDGEDTNSYGYALQDPLNRTDIQGTFPSLQNVLGTVSIATTLWGIYDNISLVHGYLSGQVSGEEVAFALVVAAATARFGGNVRLNKQAADALKEALKEAKIPISAEIRQEWHRFISGRAISGYENLLNAAREFVQLGLRK